MRTRRGLALLFIAGGITACGLGILGTSNGTGPDPGVDADLDALQGSDGLVIDGSNDTNDDATSDGSPITDAGLDVSPTNCAAGCEGGVCDGGFCTFDCTGTNNCQTGPVKCPPGIPCAVECGGSTSCNQGVDCTAASACEIRCSGTNACQGGKVACGGASCNVTCSGSTSCNQSVFCDAGSCDIKCTSTNSCQGGVVTCTAANRCGIQCGTGTNAGSTSCNQGVQCAAGVACDIRCLDTNTCQGGIVAAVAGSNSNIECSASGSCNQGASSSAGDSGVLCANTTCGGPGEGIKCDGGHCTGHCQGNGMVKFCCDAGQCDKIAEPGCMLTPCP